jgi:dTDP-4-dehydrorhamnose 3,5-epimerase
MTNYVHIFKDYKKDFREFRLALQNRVVYSPTFLKKHYQILSEENFYSIVIPEGFAHGFQTLTDNCEMIYFHTSNYNPINERGVCYDDPTLNVSWPLPVDLVSIKDKQYEYIGKSFQGVNVE